MDKNFSTKYGAFSEDGNEYIIKTYRTPKPWINVISNGDYGLVVSQTGGGFSWQTHSEFNRITRWHQDLIQDNWGKYLYIKNNNSGEIWSPTFLPVKQKLDSFECRHGIGYTVFNSIYKGIRIKLAIFVPFNDNLPDLLGSVKPRQAGQAGIEIWDLKIDNESNTEINLSIYTYFEWCLGSSADHHREFHKNFIQTEFDDQTNSIIATKRLWEIPLGDRGHWNNEYGYYGFFSSNIKADDYETEKEVFLGQYGDLINPAGIKKKTLSKQVGNWTDPIGCLKINLNLKNRESKRAAFYLGLCKDKDDIENILNKYRKSEQIDEALINVKNRWSELLGSLVIDTPDEGMNLLVNKWLRYQTISGRLWGRTAYYQQSGAFGFRDQLQDSLVYLPINPELTAKQIKLHARHQFEDGTVLHWWHPITETGLETKMTDDLLWLPFVSIQYLKETGDLNLFKEEVEYYNKPEFKESLYVHCLKAINKVSERFSERGLPLIGAGDWNDGLSAVGLEMKGESIWLAEFYYYILQEFQIVCKKLGDENQANKLNEKGKLLKKAFNNYAWDGDWFYRATKDNGEKIGSKENEEGKIYLNAQTWSVISGIADKDRQLKSMEAVKKFLLKKNGPLLLSPAYSKPDKFIGYLSRYAAGRRENGGVYMHAATWAIWAFSLLKDSQSTMKIYKFISPIKNGMNPDEYAAEPYVMPGNIDGPDSPHYGRAGWTWYTGSAAWYQKIIVDWILGIRAIEEGLLIDPCIPEEWNRFSVKRSFRGTEYFIEVKNDNHVSSGISKIILDGKESDSNIIKSCGKPKSAVEIFLG